MTEFKKGDLVVLEKPSAGIEVGSVHKVLEVTKDYYYNKQDYISIVNDYGDPCFYDSSRFRLANPMDDKMKFSLSIEEDNLADFLYKLENAYNIVSEVAKTEKAYEEAYLKLEALLDDKTGSSGLF